MNICKITKTQKIAIVSGLFVVFLAGRLLYAKYDYFQETDDMSISIGIAALINDNIGDTYRYGPQVGYYRLVQIIDMVFGSHVSQIPLIMITLSAVAGSLIPLFSFVAFRKELLYSEKILFALFLYINPVIWMSSLYGNVAIVALVFALTSIALLSNLPKKGTEFMALGLFGLGILVRADTVLLTPIIAFLLYLKHYSFKRLVITGVVSVIVMIVIYTLILLFDPRMDNVHSTVKTHLLNPNFRTKFWYYLLWSFSPLLLVFSVWGIRDLLVERLKLFTCIMLWCFPVFFFYFGSTTTPRYFLLTVFPIVLCSVFGLKKLAEILINKYHLRRRLVWIGLMMASTVHLFIGLGHFTPDSFSNIIANAFINTHDGRLYTGGFLYPRPGTILEQIFVKKSLRFPKFAQKHWFSNDIKLSLQNMESYRGKDYTTIIIHDGWGGNVFHFHAQELGVKYLSRALGRADLTNSTETWIKVGNVKVMTIADYIKGYDELKRFKVDIGDEIWILGSHKKNTFRSKIPHGLDLMPIPSSSRNIRKFKIVTTHN